MPPAGCGDELSRRYALGLDNYDRYVGNVSQLVAVDVAACADALVKLIENPRTSPRDGSGRPSEAYNIFDWKHVIAAYESLWSELSECRQRACRISPHRCRHAAAGRRSLHAVFELRQLAFGSGYTHCGHTRQLSRAARAVRGAADHKFRTSAIGTH